MGKKEKEYVQFSKRIVSVVIGGAMGFTLVVLILLFLGAVNAGEIAEVYLAFIGFSGVVFGCYSGNSAYEKYVLRKYSGENEKEESSNG